MSTKDKLIERFRKQPKDFTFDELARLLKGFGFTVSNKGKTSGSRVRFKNVELKVIIDVHKPHVSGTPVSETALREIYISLLTNHLIKNNSNE
jgi:hypothetical protein